MRRTSIASSARRRRLLLAVLAERETGEVVIAELTRAVAARDIGAKPFGVPDDTYESTFVALYQSHLSVFAVANVVERNRDAGLVGCGSSFPGLADVVRDAERRLSE